MIKRFINFMKRDYMNVSFALRELSTNRIPTWVIVLYWSLLVPICLLLYPFVKLACWLYMNKLLKDIEKGV
jgi:uncharacterized membrane protein YcfT